MGRRARRNEWLGVLVVVGAVVGAWIYLSYAIPAFGIGFAALVVLLAIAIVVGRLRPPTPVAGIVARRVRLSAGLWVALAGAATIGVLGARYRLRHDADLAAAVERQAREKKERCDDGHRGLEAARATSNDDGLLVAAQNIENGCNDLVTARSLRDEVSARREAARIEKEKKANRERWPDEKAGVERLLKDGHDLAARAKYVDADDKFGEAERRLYAFKFTDIAQELDYLDLVSRAADEKKKIAPQIEAIRQQKRKADEAAEKAAKAKVDAEERARTAQEAFENRSLYCGDGSISSCSCAGSHRGCCSHHGGVAGCR